MGEAAAGAAATEVVGRACGPALGSLLGDSDPEVRAQVAKVLGEAREPEAFSSLIRLLSDPIPRVRFFAAIALGKLGRAQAVEPLLALLRQNADSDPYLRHAGVMGLAGSGRTAAWLKAIRDESAAVRLGVLLAQRRQRDPEIARFLGDPDARLVLEAARAIHDVPIEGAMPRLASVPISASSSVPLVRRVLNAGFRLGGPEHAAGLAAVAERAELPDTARALSLELLSKWARPPGRDAVVGLWRPIAERPGARPWQPRRSSGKLARHWLTRFDWSNVQTAAIHAASELQIKSAGGALAALAGDLKRSDSMRALALKALDQLSDPRLAEAASRALALPGARSRAEALRLLAKIDPAA